MSFAHFCPTGVDSARNEPRRAKTEGKKPACKSRGGGSNWQRFAKISFLHSFLGQATMEESWYPERHGKLPTRGKRSKSWSASQLGKKNQNSQAFLRKSELGIQNQIRFKTYLQGAFWDSLGARFRAGLGGFYKSFISTQNIGLQC